MPPPERYPPDDPREWLNRARSNLVQARNRQPRVYLEDLSFQAQQAAEKALKSLLLHHRGTFPYVHDLTLLLDLLEKGGEEVPARVRESAQLNQYAVAAHYPGVAEPVEPEEYEEALKLAEDAVRWMEDALADSSASSDGGEPGEM